jgi:hypothetical protein
MPAIDRRVVKRVHRDYLLSRGSRCNYKIGNPPQKSQNQRCHPPTCAFRHSRDDSGVHSTPFFGIFVAFNERSPA